MVNTLFNTLLVIVVDGGLFFFFLYALYTTRKEQSEAPPWRSKPTKPQEAKPVQKEKPKPIQKKEPEPIQEEETEPEPSKEVETVPTEEKRKASPRRIKVIDIEGIGPVYSETLNKAGITYIDELLEVGATRESRRKLVEETGISSSLLLDWVNNADLYRVANIAEEWSDLLEEAGVSTVVELARRDPDNLYHTLVEVNEAKNLVRRLPTLNQVEEWVKRAKTLPRVVEY